MLSFCSYGEDYYRPENVLERQRAQMKPGYKTDYYPEELTDDPIEAKVIRQRKLMDFRND